MIGLDFNTPDSLIFDYIERFGGVMTSKNVIYCKYNEGQFKGKLSGERRYQADFNNCSRSMGTYHFLDGCRLRIYYRGNDKTCGRCHRPPRYCPGKGLARECQEQGGERVQLFDHMRNVWNEIKFEPSNFSLPNIDDEEIEFDKQFMTVYTLEKLTQTTPQPIVRGW